MPGYDLKQIKEYWEAQAEKYKQSPPASRSDAPVIELEINEALK